MTLSEELSWRGLVNQTTYPDLSALDKAAISFYWGVDPSADSMTIGNLAAAMMVKCFIKHGHQAVLLIGGATGLIGDPDGKKDERNLLSEEQLAANKAAIVSQYKRLFGENQFKLVDNIDWFKDKTYLDFLREVGKHVPMRQMLARDFVKSRLGESGSGISYAEFSYVLIQAYDFLHLFTEMGVSLQVCGADQWGNCIAGVDLIRRKTGQEAHVYSVPLIVDEASGQKFGKSEAGAVWLDPAKTSPTQFYQFWVNVSDASVEAYLKIFSELGRDEVEKIMQEQQADPGKRVAQRRLAKEVTRLVHGEAASELAEALTEVLTGQRELGELSDQQLDQLRKEIAHTKAHKDADTVEILVDSQLASSKTEARQLLSSRAVYINGQPVTKANLDEADFKDGRLLIRRGKAYKDSALVELG